MNKENTFKAPHLSSPEITEEQKARISQKFRAAKALLARKRPYDAALLSDRNCPKNEYKPGIHRQPLCEVQSNTPSLLAPNCARPSEIASIRWPCNASFPSHNHVNVGDKTQISRVPLSNVNTNTPYLIPSKCGRTTEMNSIRSCPERISRRKDHDFVSYGSGIVEGKIKDESNSASITSSTKQNDFFETVWKKNDCDNVSYGLATVEAPIEGGSLSNSFVTPMRQSECANLIDDFALAADLDEVFDESVLKEIDALCEERSAKKKEQNDTPHSDLSDGSQCNGYGVMGMTSVESVNVNDAFKTEGTIELGDRKEVSVEGSGNAEATNIGTFPQAYSDYLQGLNEQQKEAACSDISIPLMIVAGPGSGKTSTMVGRVLMLLNEGIGPTNILAMTFTTAAASEMRDRIGAVAGKEVAKQLTISTFHSFCLQLCRTHADKLGRTSEFLIYGHGQQRRAIIEAVRLFESKKSMGENSDALKLDDYGDMSCAQYFKDKSKKWQKFVTQAKASGKTPVKCRKMGDEIGAAILENYDCILRSCNALDYHDLISCSVSLLTDFPEVCAESQDLWKAMVIDEFQDTSAMQYNFLRILASHNHITIVGDEDQSIFSFNGADASGFDSFRKDFPNHREVKLTKNYRSTRCIVEAASFLIHHNVNRCQTKQVLTDNCSGSKISVKECHNEDAQCSFVVDKILESASSDSDAKGSFGNVAILYRRQVSGKVFQTAFRDRKIPFNVHGVAFYRKKIIKAIMAMLRTTLPGCDDGAFRQTFKAILSCDKEEKKKVVNYIDKISTIRKSSFISAARDIFAAKVSGTFKRSQLSQGQKVLSTLDIISKLVRREQSISAVITSVANMLPQKYLLEQRAVIDVDGGKLLNEDNDLRPVLQYLLDDVSNFLANNFSQTTSEKNNIGEQGCTYMLKEFIDYISMRESENFRCRRQENKDSVTLTTIHQSKGLEWDTVFIVKANEGEIPLLHENNGFVNGNVASLEEERRLLYVAMTRARKKLYILYVTVDSRWQLLQPSRFLGEIPHHLREIQTELNSIKMGNKHENLSSIEVTDAAARPEKLIDIQTDAPTVHLNGIVSAESVELLEACNGDTFLKKFNVEDRAMISHLFHQWARKKAFGDPKRLLDKHLQTWWHNYNIQGEPSYVLTKKLQLLKTDLKQWRRRTLRRSDEKIQEIEAQLQILNDYEEEQHLTTTQLQDRGTLLKELEKWYHREDHHWAVRAKTKTMSKGDRMTTYFHKMANSRQQAMQIKTLTHKGRTVEDSTQISSIVVDYYKKLFKEQKTSRPMPEGLAFPQLDEQQVTNLEAPITTEEIKATLESMAQDKSPGPDGFPVGFFSKAWDVVGADVLNMVEHFNKTTHMNWRLNNRFVALIPKCQGATSVTDYRPISLLNSCYKLVTRCLATRLSKVLPYLVSPQQASSIKGRHLTDAVLIANELIDTRKRMNKPGLLCKLDFRKAFNSVSWECIDFVLRKYGFGQKWRAWIRTCISTPHFSILINGKAHDFFKSSKGLRQGDPLSPLLFNMVADVLTRMVMHAQDHNWIHGFQMKKDGTSIPISQFADDTLLFIDANKEEVTKLKSIFTLFELTSGLQLNLGKSVIYGVALEENHDLHEGLGCTKGHLPATYLGMPLGGRFKAKEQWNSVIEKIKAKLATWKIHLLSKGGRLILLKSTLSTIPLFSLSLFLMPKSVLHTIEKLMKKFLWGSEGTSSSLSHLINWQTCCYPVDKGGLGIHSMDDMNIALLGKWSWRFLQEPVTTYWKSLLIEKYGLAEDDTWTNTELPTHGCSLWKTITNTCKEIGHKYRIRLGDGQNTSFWHSLWLEQQTITLASQFPMIYNCCRTSHHTLADVWCNEQSTWDLKLRRRLTQTMQDELIQLQGLLPHTMQFNRRPDMIQWSLDPKNGEYTVNSLVKDLERSRTEHLPRFPSQAVWSSKIPAKVSFLSWCLIHRRANTQDRIQSHGIPTTQRCTLCQSNGEDFQHLFEACTFTAKLWETFEAEFQQKTGNRVPIEAAYGRKSSQKLTPRGQLWWYLIPHAINWVIWEERNQRIFSGKGRAQDQVHNQIGFVIDERLRIKNQKNKDVLRTLRSCLTCAEAFQYAQNILRWEKLPAEQRAHLTREKQEHFQKLRIENAMGSSEATPKQVAYLQSLGCTVVPTSRLHASRLIEQYKAL